MVRMEFDRMVEVLRALEVQGVRYAVFGGAALNFHGIARFTEAVDLFILATRENVEALTIP
jgi:predicted nucleotidyltransferase